MMQHAMCSPTLEASLSTLIVITAYVCGDMGEQHPGTGSGRNS